MKTIELKQVKHIDPAGNEAVLDYADYLRAIMQSPMNTQTGADIEEIRHSIRILDAIDNASGNQIEIEDADYAFLIRKINAAKFMFITPEILQFINDMTGGA